MDIHAFHRACTGPALRVADAAETAGILETVQRMPAPALARIAAPRLRAAVDAAIAEGGGIAMVGMAPADIEIAGHRFAARAHVRLTTRERFDVRVEGVVDAQGLIVADAAITLDS